MLKQCYCEQLNSFDSFSCFICKKHQHWQCYDYQLTDKHPTQIRCLSCTFNANNPFMQFEQYVRLNNKFNVATLKKTSQQTEKVFTFDVNQYFEELKKKTIILSIFCTKLKDAKKLYEWPSKNIYIEFNGQHHIQYNSNDYGYIPSTCIQWGNNTIKIKMVDEIEYTSVFGLAIVRNVKLSEIRARLLDVGREKIIEQIITQQKQQYEEKIKSLLSNDDSIKQDALLNIKLIDGLTQQQLEIPVRGKNCLHFDCFELNSYLTFNEKPSDNRWKCPLCNQQVPVDLLQIDYVQVEILHDIKITYPSIFHKLQRVQLNQFLEYKIEDQYQEIDQIKTKLHLSQVLIDVIEINTNIIEKGTDHLGKFILEFQRKDNYQVNYLLLRSAKKLLKKLQQKDLFKNFFNEKQNAYIQISKFFFEMFQVKENLKCDLFEDIIALQYFQQLQDFELICKLIYNKTVSGLFIYFLRLFNNSSLKINQILAAYFAEGKLYEQKNSKILEIYLACSYDKKQKISLGQSFKYLCCQMKTKKEDYYNMIIYLSQKLSQVFYNTELSGLFIVRNCINLSSILDMFNLQDKSNLDDYQLTIQLIKEIYSLELIKQNPNILEILRLILFLMQKRDKKFENILNSFQEYNLGDIKNRFRNMDYNGEYYYL